jgi:hypothetical protein
MTFTNTDCVENVLYWYEVWDDVVCQLNNQVFDQVSDQVPHQVFEQIKSIRNKIHQELDK